MNIRKSRRELLKEFGLLGVLAGTLRDSIARADAGGQGIRRVLFYYLPGGLHLPAWRPRNAQSGVAIDAPAYGQMDKSTGRHRHALDVFDDPKYAALKRDMMLVEGIDMRAIVRPDVHVNGISCGLRGRPDKSPDPAENGKFPGYSLDRLLGEAFDRQERGDNLLVSQCTNVLVSELGQQASVGAHSQGYNARVVRSSGEAWDLFLKELIDQGSGARPDNSAEIARQDGEVARWELSIGSANKVKALLPASEVDKLDGLVQVLRAKQDEHRRVARRLRGGTAGVTVRNPPARVESDPDPSRFMKEKSDLLAGVMSLALGLGRTQVAVWQTCGSNNDKGLWYYDGRQPNFHNSIAHGGAYQGIVSPATWSVYEIEMQMLGNILLALKAIPEGGGTALDSTLVVTYSDMSDGGHHFHTPAFTLLAGGRNGRLGGRALRLGSYIKLPMQRPNNDLLLTVAHLAGVTTARDSKGAVTELDSFGSTKHSTGIIRDIFA
jgi:hypothetical protein